MADAGRPKTDAWYHQTITHRAAGRTLAFRTSQSLFSSHEVDAGTRLLLREIAASPIGEPRGILDAGCGYGVIGITLAAMHPGARIHMADRDALAVAFARENAEANGIAATAAGSLGFDDVHGTFDLVAMNVPGKAGDAVIRHLLRGAYRCLAPGGAVAIVAVAPLAPLVEATLTDGAIEVIHERATSAYRVAVYRFRGAPEPPEPDDAFAAGIYARARSHFEAGGAAFELATSYGLAEFDQPSYATRLLLGEIAAKGPAPVGRAAVLNPNQGHAAVALHAAAEPRHLALIGRDLLALRTTASNLAAAGRDAGATSIHHIVGFPGGEGLAFDAVLATIDDADPIDASAGVLGDGAAALAPGGTMLVATTSTTAVRLARRLTAAGLRADERARRHGAAVLAVAR